MLLENAKALVVVLVLGVLVFHAARPLCLQFSAPADFARRRNIWLVLTVAGFLLPSFWLYVLLAAPLLLWAGRKDTNPVALYFLLMHVIPPIDVAIPAIGVNRLFPLDMYRLLSLCVLLPAALRLRHSRDSAGERLPRSMEMFLWGFGALQILLFVRPDTPDAFQLHDSLTNVLRRAFLFVIDAYLLYYVASRSSSGKALIKDSLATFLLASLIMAPMAIFEGLKPWALYAGVGADWGGQLMFQYNFRGGHLRAVVAAGHSLALGYLLAVALGFWLYLRTKVEAGWLRIGIPLILALGVFFSYSRGPWVGAVLIYLTFALVGPRGHSALFKALVVSALTVGLLMASPLGHRIANVIPFAGSSQSTYNVTYREELAARSLQMVEQHPLFGDQNAYSELSDLRTGIGIIDFVDSYAFVAVFYGLVGLFFFSAFILSSLFKVYRTSRSVREEDPDLALLGGSLVACILGTLFMIGTSSFIFGYAQMFYFIGGIAAAYAKLGKEATTRATNLAAASSAG